MPPWPERSLAATFGDTRRPWHGVTRTAGASPEAMATLTDQLPRQDFRRHIDMRGLVEFGPVATDDFETCALPCLPAEALLALSPGLLKLTRPLRRGGHPDGPDRSAAGSRDRRKLDAHSLPIWSMAATSGLRQTWVPRAGDPLLRLRRATSLNGHAPGLMLSWPCTTRSALDQGLRRLAAGRMAIPRSRVLVVDDGSTDGSGDLVRADLCRQ